MTTHIKEFDNSITTELCEEIINNFEEEIKNNKNLNSIIDDNSTIEFIFNSIIKNDWNRYFNFLLKEVSNKIKIYLKNSAYNFININDNDFYIKHFIIKKYIFPKNAETYKNIKFSNPYGIITFIWHLGNNNEPDVDDKINEPNLNIKPKVGKLLLFPSLWSYNINNINTRYIIIGRVIPTNNYTAKHFNRIVKSDLHKINVIKKRFIFEKFMKPDECEYIINEAEKFALKNDGWTTDRHNDYPTTDIPIYLIKNIYDFIETTYINKIKTIIKDSYGIIDDFILFKSDIFIIKYEYGENKQNSLDMHVDDCTVSISILLSDPNDFIGGGTKYEDDNVTYKVEKGDMLMHTGEDRHCGLKITSGKRYLLIFFLDLNKISNNVILQNNNKSVEIENTHIPDNTCV